LPDRLPVLEAWVATAPPQPLPQCLASIELRRTVAQHGITVDLAATWCLGWHGSSGRRPQWAVVQGKVAGLLEAKEVASAEKE